MILVKYCVLLCVASLVTAQRTPPPRMDPPTLELVDSRPGFSPLYQGSDPSLRRNGRHIIKLKETTRFDDMGRLVGKLSDQNKNAPAGSVPVRGMSGYSTVGLGVMAELNKDVLDVVRQDQAVKYVEEDQVVHNASEYWHRDRVDQMTLPLNMKYCPPNDGENVDIYVLDTGIDYCHKDFCDNRAQYAGYSPVVSASNPNSRGCDCNGHGTHAAALAAGGIHCIAKKAKVYSLPVLGCDGRGSFTNIILALNHVVMRANSEPERRVIVSMSLIGPVSLAVNEAVKRVTKEGIVVITAAGNFLTDACKYTPSSSPHAITVGGTARNDLLYATTFSGTNWGRCVDIFAPGQDIESAGRCGCNVQAIAKCNQMCDRESTMSGTSMATPIVAGAAAILLSADMSLTPAQVKQKLISDSAKNRIDMRDIRPTSRTVTPNRLLYVGKKRCPRKSRDPCESSEPELCGRPWEYQATEFLPSVEHNKLTRVINKQRNKKNRVPSFIAPYNKGSDVYFAVIFKRVSNVSNYQVVFDIDGNRNANSLVKSMADENYRVVLATSYYVDNTLYHMIVFLRSSSDLEIRVRFDQPSSTYAKYSKSAIKDGLSLVSRRVTVNSRGRNRYTTIYRLNSGRKTVEQDELTFDVLEKKINRQRRNKRYLVHIDTYVVKGETRYSVIFTNEKIGECKQEVISGRNQTEIDNIAENHRKDGFLMTAVAIQSQTSFPLFMGVFRK
ncbi:aqualysin-1-like [Dysidea avara]|uniref:aqualysin-1-like n=1 Tax=Dysidea avara TaxID=196820 RepID=UPI00331B6BBB